MANNNPIDILLKFRADSTDLNRTVSQMGNTINKSATSVKNLNTLMRQLTQAFNGIRTENMEALGNVYGNLSNVIRNNIQDISNLSTSGTAGASKMQVRMEKLEQTMMRDLQTVQQLIARLNELKNQQIPTEAYSKLQEELAKAEATYSKLTTNRGLAKLEREFSALAEKAEEYEQTINRLLDDTTQRQTLQSLGWDTKSANAQQLEANAQVAVREIEAELSKLYATMGSAKFEPLKDFKKELHASEKEVETLTAKMREMEANGKAFTPAGVKTEAFANTQRELANVLTRIRETSASYRDMGERISNTANKGASDTNKLGHSVSNVGANARKAKSEFSQTFSALSNSANKVLGLFKKLHGWTSKLRANMSKTWQGHQRDLKHNFTTLLKYAFGVRSLFFLFKRLRSAVKDAFASMAQSVPEVNKVISSLKTQLNTLKGMLGTMFQPLLHYFTPIIQTILKGLETVMTKVAEFFAVLTGQKYIYKASSAWQDYADSVDGASKSTKEMNKQLAGFDKLNNLTTPDDSSGSGKDPTGGLSFVKQAVASNYWADLIKEALAKGDFTDLGKEIARKIADALNSIDWDSIKNKVNTFAKYFAQFINGIVSVKDLAKALGKTVAEALNTAFEGLNTFADTVEWDKVGTFIVTGIQTFLETAQTYDWGESIGSLIRGLLEALYKIVSNREMWSTLGQKIRDGIKGFQEGMAEETDTFDMTGWELLGGSIGEIVLGIIDTATEVIGDTDMWEGFGEAVAQVLKEIPWSDIIVDLAELALAIITALASSLDGMSTEFGHSIAESIGGEEFANAFGDSLGGLIRTALMGGNWRVGNLFGALKVTKNINKNGEAYAENFKKGFEEEYGDWSIEKVINRKGTIDRKLFDQMASDMTGKGNTIATRFLSGFMQGITEEQARGRSGKLVGVEQGILRIFGIDLDVS